MIFPGTFLLLLAILAIVGGDEGVPIGSPAAPAAPRSTQHATTKSTDPSLTWKKLTFT